MDYFFLCAEWTQAMSRIGAIRPKESDVAAKQALAKIAIKKEDIELIVSDDWMW